MYRYAYLQTRKLHQKQHDLEGNGERQNKGKSQEGNTEGENEGSVHSVCEMAKSNDTHLGKRRIIGSVARDPLQRMKQGDARVCQSCY